MAKPRPVGVLVVGLPVVAIIAILLATRFVPGLSRGATPHATPVAQADLLMQDHTDGSISVRRAGDDALVDTVPPASNGFLRVVLAGLVRERRREGEGSPSIPFHLTRWSDGRLTIDDLATHRLIELDAFGPANAGAFEKLLEASERTPSGVGKDPGRG